MGVSVRVTLVDRQTALRAHEPFRLVPNTMVRSPFRIPPSAASGHIRYRFAFRDGLSFDLPQTGEQRALIAGDVMIVDVCEGCGPVIDDDPATLHDALRATAWLESDHPRIRAIAAPVARLQVSDARKMELLVARARPYLERVDFASHYSALDTLDRRAGDCTEAAVLLAALGRAAGIPTRVASGIVYSRLRYHGVSNAFMPHSWTLAYVDGEWRSFDLALDTFDSTHIAFTISDGDASSIAAATQLAGLLTFADLAEIRPLAD
jgi:transglutaminase-like putative cysteine protease